MLDDENCQQKEDKIQEKIQVEDGEKNSKPEEKLRSRVTEKKKQQAVDEKFKDGKILSKSSAPR